MLRVLDLFSGIGGFSLGLERTGGFETVAFCELKKRARAVLAKHWPDVRQHDDVTTYGFYEGEADVITAGFPCQDISFAGVGAGLAGARSGLYREVIRAVRVVRPQWAVLENVAALLSRGLGTVLGDLAAIGYDAEWHCIPASAVGAPHRRDRIWIVANPGSVEHEGGRAPLSGTLAKELSSINSDASGERRAEAWELRRDEPTERSASIRQEVADAAGSGRRKGHKNRTGRSKGAGEASERARSAIRSWWRIEPDVGRVAHGVPARVDRLEELGNAVVPQIPELIGNAILASMEAT